MLANKKILLCVTGGIAVYKAAALTSKLTQAGAIVRVMLSESASKFVTPLTFQAMSRQEVYVDTFIESRPEVIAHIDAADWADIVLIAPATANVIGKLAHGIADNMITTTLLATQASIWIAPAMNVHMYENKIVQENMDKLRNIGYRFIEPSEGYLACGYTGKGRLEEPENIVTLLQSYYESDQLLKGQRILITAGPTRERIDAVRFFTNHSTGKMGYALAEVAASLGADVTLVSGPTILKRPANINYIQVETAEQMYNHVHNLFEEVDIVIKTAAVADYRPKHVYEGKLKKKQGDLTIELERTKDILQSLGERKTKQFLVGFAAETNNVLEYAHDKLVRKNLDMIVANDVSLAGAGFGGDTNIVTILTNNGDNKTLPLMSKHEVAKELLQMIANVIGSE
ncbi:bifunctional phosphopantothenoylcysteine decarboxylase/phosphopantothenate--cysteine ligase CoaBC [Bacillus sp. HMF5848]|uniref:bifunctional phosphopantothenoylcysteine decarboxylase/phosphopantothenate--cysteine ligase CoaBC n=1 Tax=Bacillus sp. HMF5848 TaxID=2495421 RepID=UPI000F776F6C|nr:bifunctional phosphopantothenoylcysteine decarboxylase/phosphopantothenate--cysteine ligase CoaBC [Bacillus sp. HMF5848]RSK29308.1 bifunctional phosphopantothenoylcysteine decarboxylase/phosphopantothenate--cysteine ligase CoaBC [Bacillus sp. HMF5848]